MESGASSDETSSNYSTESSDDDRMETAEVADVRLQLPQGFCDRKDLFMDVLSMDTWNQLSDTHRQYLQTFLPNFPVNDHEEKNRTLQKLFGLESFRFGNPLEKFHDDLKAGYYRPDIAKMRGYIRKAEKKEAHYRYRKYREKLRQDVLKARRTLLDQVNSLPPGIEPKPIKPEPIIDYVSHRTKRRYCQILMSIQTKVDDTYCSPDDNYPEGPPVSLSRKQRRHLNSIKNHYVANTTKIYNSTMQSKSINLDLERYITPNHNPFYITDENYRNLIIKHKRRKLQHPDDPELHTKGLTLNDIVNRTQLPYIKTNLPSKDNKTNRKKIKFHKSSSDSDSDSLIETKIKPKTIKIHTPKIKNELPDGFVKNETDTTKIVQTTNHDNLIKPINSYTPVTLSDLEGIDMMNIPIDLDNSDIDILELNNKPELMQETHSNFLSLIRDIICSTSEHRMDMQTLEQRLKAWQENPISPLNDWYSITDNWVNLLKSAVNFLCGNATEQPDDFVPYMEYKTPLDMYQWIGAGRDSDSLLSPLCTYWLEHRVENKSSQKERDEMEIELSDRAQTPPPPRCPTNWTVRKATLEEVKDFREQERRRYDNPHKAFTYRCNGYESVVGPLKGIYNPAVGNTKARGHTMLSADRPNFVTILSLVRDATARLPNGEGTRADICELLKSSQYISSTAPDNVLQSVVSGALDRMHTQFDPCVKYDPKRKIWIYLHRNRSEEDFERIHQQYQGVNKTSKKTTLKKAPSKAKPKNEKPMKVQKDEDKTKIKAKSPTKSLLLTNNLVPKNDTTDTAITTSPKTIKLQPQDEKEINDALQAIVQNRVASPITKPIKGKSLVKIITPSPGKSLIIPSNNQRTTPTKQLLQLAQQQQQKIQLIQQQQQPQTKVDGEKVEKLKVPVTVQQQYIQSITSQQLQNIKNVTLVRNLGQGGQTMTLTPVVTLAQPQTQQEQTVQIKTQSTLTPAQQQLIQTIKQKIMPQTGQQPIILKQKPVAHLKGAQSSASILGQTKINDGNKTIVTTQNPVVAKVLTNAAGQVISVESLLAHQKQHGSLPQGTTLRVSGTKSGQTNIIQLTPATKANTLAQFAVGSQNNIITLTNQPKLVVTSQAQSNTTTTVTTATTTNPIVSVAVTRSLNKSVKFPPKIAQQLINAKLVDGQKLVQPKIYVGQQPQQQGQVKLTTTGTKSKAVTLNAPNTIRMVNAANLNLTHIGGKPVLLASKTNTIQGGQNLILQPNLQTTVKNTQNTSANFINQSNVVLGPQLKVQPAQVVLGGAGGGVKVATSSVNQQNIVLSGHPVRLQSGNASNATQRVVVASQGQGGQIVAQQILLPAGFQGTAINIKALQGVKVIPIAQAQGVQGRQMFARVMSPGVVKSQQLTPNSDKIGSDTPTTTNATQSSND